MVHVCMIIFMLSTIAWGGACFLNIDMALALTSVLLLFSCVANAALSQGGLLYYSDVGGSPYEVKYDNRSFVIAGQRTLLLGGAVHYARVVEGEWSTIFSKMRADGLNMVQTYLFWNIHEPVRGQQYDMNGTKNWTRFVELAGESGLFVSLRVGPFVAAEWDYGGIPFWVSRIPGMVVRSNNEPWKKEMQRFVSDMIALARPHLASQGGPIIVAQVENEFHWQDPAYVEWCGELAEKMQAGIPWMMCNGESAHSTINTCNGNDCSLYAEAHGVKYPGQPLAWTENEGWFQTWNTKPLTEHDNRPASEMAYVVMRWIARGGAYHNYYMWYGGNNFGRKAGSCITTMYADGVNLHSDGLPNEPKKSHLHKLHLQLGAVSPLLMDCPGQANKQQYVEVYDPKTGHFNVSKNQFVFAYRSKKYGSLYFLENTVNSFALVRYMNITYELAGQSSLLLDYQGLTLYNSSDVQTKGIPTQRVLIPRITNLNWTMWWETPVMKSRVLITDGRPSEQLNVTNDLTDFLFYNTWIPMDASGTVTIPTTDSDAIHVFIDDSPVANFISCNHDPLTTKKSYSFKVSDFSNFTEQMTILSVSLGLNTHTAPGERDMKGIIGDVTLGDQSFQEWQLQVGLEGERKKVFTKEGAAGVDWSSNIKLYHWSKISWYRATFDSVTVPENSSLLLDLSGMSRGFIYINGFNLGRYWMTQVEGEYVQQFYYLPPSLLQPKENLLVLFDEDGAPNPESVRLLLSSMVVPSR